MADVPQVEVPDGWVTFGIEGREVYRFNGDGDIEIVAPDAYLNHLWMHDPDNSRKAIALLLLTIKAQHNAIETAQARKILSPHELNEYAQEQRALLARAAHRGGGF